MTCLELRRRLLIDPHRMDADMTYHIVGCAACRAAADRAVAFEMRLQAAFDVAEPPNLIEPVTSAVGSSSSKRGRDWIPRFHGGNANVSAQAMSHLRPYTLTTVEPVPAAKLHEVLEHAGAVIAGADIRVTYAANCTIERKTAAHLVIPSAHGPVTVFLMPRVSIDAPKTFADDRWVGRIEPFGAGSVALIALQPAALDDADARIRMAFAVGD